MLEWMAWSPPVAIFFVCIGLMLAGIRSFFSLVHEVQVLSRSSPRKVIPNDVSGFHLLQV
ncbi:MAG: hypothetical protein EBX02_04900 [Betaproteobacteria bacterium]|nr:hypothetical protein [Betaproteobacteria bacterium]